MKKKKSYRFSTWEILKISQFIIGAYTIIALLIFLSFYNDITESLLAFGALAWVLVTILCLKFEPKSWGDESENNSNNN